MKGRLRYGYDLVFLVYPEDLDVGLDARSGQLRHLFLKAGLL
jgi:hypothetical protein